MDSGLSSSNIPALTSGPSHGTMGFGGSPDGEKKKKKESLESLYKKDGYRGSVFQNDGIYYNKMAYQSSERIQNLMEEMINNPLAFAEIIA
jgi:hypothetical protein